MTAEQIEADLGVEHATGKPINYQPATAGVAAMRARIAYLEVEIAQLEVQVAKKTSPGIFPDDQILAQLRSDLREANTRLEAYQLQAACKN